MLGAGDAARARAAAARMIGWSVARRRARSRSRCSRSTDVDPARVHRRRAVIERAHEIWSLFAAMMPLNGAVFALDGILIGAGDTRFLMWGMLAAAAVYVPVALLALHQGWGIVGVWCGLAGADRACALLTCGAALPGQPMGAHRRARVVPSRPRMRRARSPSSSCPRPARARPRRRSPRAAPFGPLPQAAPTADADAVDSRTTASPATSAAGRRSTSSAAALLVAFVVDRRCSSRATRAARCPRTAQRDAERLRDARPAQAQAPGQGARPREARKAQRKARGAGTARARGGGLSPWRRMPSSIAAITVSITFTRA